MWYMNENGNLEQPAALDTESSKKFVYVRKNFEEVPKSGSGKDAIPAHWKWQEMKIRKEDWAVYEKVLGHDSALDDVYAALTELAEMIVEG